MVKKTLANAGIPYELVDAAAHQDLVEKYGVSQAPSLVAVTRAGTEKYAGAAAVMNFIQTHAVKDHIA